MRSAIIFERFGDVTVLFASGRITLGKSVQELGYTIDTLAAAGHRKMLLDLKAVTYIDSRGIEELLSCFTKAKDYGAQLKLLHLKGKRSKTASDTKLYSLFEVYEDEEAAISSFSDR